jgi:hypothetical protein
MLQNKQVRYGKLLKTAQNTTGNGLEERRKYVVQLKEIMDYEKCINRDY